MRGLRKHWMRWLSLLLLGVAVWVFGEQVSGQLQTLELDVGTIRWHYIVFSFLLFPIVVGWHGLVWSWILPRSERHKMSVLQVLKIHGVYWLTRYIPGTAPTLVSKIVAGQQYDIPKRTLALASMYEQIIQIFTALGLGILLSLTAWSLESSPMVLLGITLGGGVVTLGVLHPRIFYPLANAALKVFNKDPLAPESLLSYTKLLYLAGLYLLGQIGNGVAFFALVKAFAPLENSLIVPLIGFYSLAGVIGVLTIFVPSGIGVREGILVSLLAQFVPLPLAITITIAARLVNTLSDGLIFVALGIHQFRRYLSGRLVFGIWSLGVLGVLVWFSQLYTSSYIDEYWHIFAGRDWWGTWEFAELYSTGPYLRGSIISIMSGALQSLFGNALWIQKLIPVGLSMITYGCLMAVSRQVWPRQWHLSALLGGIWVLSPWLLFNHQYVRMYVWYELVFVAGLWAVLSSSALPWKQWAAVQGGILLASGIVFQFAYDNSVLLPLAGILLAQALLFGMRSGGGRLGRWIRVLIVMVGGGGVLLSSWGQRQIETFLTTDFIFATQENYLDFFLERNTVVSVMGMVGISIWLIRGTQAQRILALVGAVLVWLHLISAPDVQLIRSIVYLLPLLYLLSIVPLWYVSQSRSVGGKITAGLLAGLLIWGVYQSYPFEEGFLADQHLMIPGEIHAIDYQRGYQYLKDHCQGRTLYETSPTPYLGEFYGVTIDAAVVTQREWLELDTIFRPVEDGFVVHYSAVPVITDIPDLDDEFCWIQRTPSLGRYLSVEAINIQATITDFVGIRVVER